MSLVAVAAFLRPCVSLKWQFGTTEWSWLSCIGAWRPQKAGQCLLFSIWSAVSARRSSRATNCTSGFQLSSYYILYPTLLSQQSISGEIVIVCVEAGFFQIRSHILINSQIKI